MGRPCAQPLRSFHPKGVFTAQLREVRRKCLARILGRNQADHGEEEGRLRAGEVVGACAVRHMTVGIDEIGEVADHAVHQVAAAAGREPEHGEVRIPVVHLAEAASRNHVGIGHRQQGRVRRCGGGRARQRIPETIDMRDDGYPVGRGGRSDDLRRQGEMRLDERFQGGR